MNYNVIREKLEKMVAGWREEAVLPALREVSNAWLMESVAGEVDTLIAEVFTKRDTSGENKHTFFARLFPRLSPSDVIKVRGAYYFSKFGHRAQLRREEDKHGIPLRYFEHCRRVAINLMDEAQCYEPDLIIAALLHDALEDTEAIDEYVVEQFFGSRVAMIVRQLTKKPVEGYIERLETADPDTVLVKACDRLDNLRSLLATNDEAFIKKQYDDSKKYEGVFTRLMLRHSGIKIAIKLQEEMNTIAEWIAAREKI